MGVLFRRVVVPSHVGSSHSSHPRFTTQLGRRELHHRIHKEDIGLISGGAFYPTPPPISFFCGQLVVRTFHFFRRTCCNSSCQPRWKLQLELDVGSGSALCVTISNTPDSESTGGTTSARQEARVIKRMWTRRWQERGRPPKKRRTCTCVSERRVTVGKAKKFIGLHTDSLFRQQSAEIRYEETRTCFYFVLETTGRGQYPLRSLALWKSKKMFVGSSFDHSTSPKMAALASMSTRKGFSSWRT